MRLRKAVVGVVLVVAMVGAEAPAWAATEWAGPASTPAGAVTFPTSGSWQGVSGWCNATFSAPAGDDPGKLTPSGYDVSIEARCTYGTESTGLGVSGTGVGTSEPNKVELPVVIDGTGSDEPRMSMIDLDVGCGLCSSGNTYADTGASSGLWYLHVGAVVLDWAGDPSHAFDSPTPQGFVDILGTIRSGAGGLGNDYTEVDPGIQDYGCPNGQESSTCLEPGNPVGAWPQGAVESSPGNFMAVRGEDQQTNAIFEDSNGVTAPPWPLWWEDGTSTGPPSVSQNPSCTVYQFVLDNINQLPYSFQAGTQYVAHVRVQGPVSTLQLDPGDQQAVGSGASDLVSIDPAVATGQTPAQVDFSPAATGEWTPALICDGQRIPINSLGGEGVSGGGSSGGLASCLNSSGLGLDPSSWVPGLVSDVGCLLKAVFVPSSSGTAQLSAMWNDIQTKAPFSYVYEAADVIPTAARAVNDGVTANTGSCADLTGGASLGLPGNPSVNGCLDTQPGVASFGFMRTLVQWGLYVGVAFAVWRTTSNVVSGGGGGTAAPEQLELFPAS